MDPFLLHIVLINSSATQSTKLGNTPRVESSGGEQGGGLWRLFAQPRCQKQFAREDFGGDICFLLYFQF